MNAKANTGRAAAPEGAREGTPEGRAAIGVEAEAAPGERTAGPAVVADGVRFTYDGDSYALDGVTASVREGEFLCILGGNGSGKSTFAKHVNALLTPDEGRVLTCGMDTSDARFTYDIRQSAGMVFQNPDDQLVASLVEDDVAFGPENLGVAPGELRRRVSECLDAVGLSGFERHETYALSGGQKQRVAIAGALAMNPRILVLDEASAMLDPRGRNGLMRVVRKLVEDGMTVVMITHFMEEAAAADRVIVMEGGRIACSGAPEDVLADEALLRRLNLEVPFAARLSHALIAAGVPITPAVTERALVENVAAALEGRAEADADAAAFGNAAGPDRDSAENAKDTRDAGTPREENAAAIDEEPNGSGTNGAHTCAAKADEPRAVIELQGVSFTYDAAEAKRARKRAGKPAAKQAKWGNSPDALWALSDVSLRVREGEFLGIAGHTGSGKSTLIQHMNGILSPTEGRVLVAGRDAGDKRGAAHARATVGVVFQYPENQLFAATVAEDVAFGPRNLGLSQGEIDARVDEALSAVGLTQDIKGKSPFELSGGQQRRVAFAGVLAMRPRVLVLDEPAAGLDPAARISFLRMVKRFHEDGMTVVMVSHNMDDLAELCGRVVVLNEGKIALEGSPEEVFSQAEALKAIGLSTTSANRAAALLRKRGIPVATRGLATESDVVAAVRRAWDASRGLEDAR